MPDADIISDVNFALAGRRAGIGAAINDLDEDPDRAARAVELGKATGIPPALIHGNQDEFERQHRAFIVSDILSRNEKLRNWAREDPMATKVASDDWGQLDTITNKAHGAWFTGLPSVSPAPVDRVFRKTVEGFAKAFGSAMGTGEQSLAEEYEKLPYYARIHLYPGIAKFQTLSAMLTGGLHAIHEGAAQTAREFGASESQAQSFAREAAGFAEFKTMDVAAKGIHPPTVEQAISQRFEQAWKKAEPYLKAGQKPPVGTDPLIDRVYAEQAKFDHETLDSILDEAEKSLTRERAPDVFSNLIARVTGKKEIAIPVEAAQRLYGSRVPSADDGLLGWATDFAKKYEEAKVTGEDIRIPMYEYIANVDKDVRKALEKDYKPDPDGMSLNEAEAASEKPIPVPPEPEKPLVDNVRDAASLNQIQPVLVEGEEAVQAPLFGKMALGLPKKLYDRWQKLIDRQSAEDRAWELRQKLDEIKRSRTKEWLQEADAMRPVVRAEIGARPEFQANAFFRFGELKGIKEEAPRLDPEKMTAAQRDNIPERFLKKGGSDPDDIAPQVGFPTGDAMLNTMIRFEREKGDLNHWQHLEKLVEQEVARRMEEQYGKQADAILAGAQDHALGLTQMDRLHEQTVGLGMAAKAEITFTKQSMNRAAVEGVGRQKVGAISRDSYLKRAGQAGRDMMEAFTKGDWNEAFKQSQSQYLATLMAKETAKLEKEKKIFEKTAKRFRKAMVEGYDNIFGGAYVPFIQQVLQRMGRDIDRLPENLADAVRKSGYRDLHDFVRGKQSELKEISLPDFLYDGNIRPMEGMTVSDFRDAHRGLKQMVKSGRDESILYKEGVAHEIKDIVEGKMVDKIKELGANDIDISQAHKFKTSIKTWYAKSLTAESMLNRIDKDDPLGAHNQFVVRPLTEAANYEARLIRVYEKALLKAAGPIKNIDKLVENSLWLNPVTKTPFTMRQRNVLGILAYWGSPGSRKKLLEGYGVPEAVALKWLEERTTKEDWSRMQDIGRIFERLSGLADKMSMEISGAPIEKIAIEPFTNRHGNFKGWYNPIDYSSLFPGRKDVMSGEKILEGEGYKRATTPQGYTKERTDYTAPVELNLDQIPVTMRQMIHDIAFRPAVLQAAKVFHNTKWRQTMIHYYSKERAEEFIPYLKDVANYSNQAPDFGNIVIEHFRQNMIATLVGFNPHTVAKHGMTAAANSMTEVGPLNFLKALKSLTSVNEETGTTNWRFALNTSEELQRRGRNIEQLFLRDRPEISLKDKSFRETVITLGSKPVALSDLFSAVPTWLAKYESAIREGKDVGQAIFEGDRAVRRAHGSSAITNLPAIMRGNALAKTFTSLYGFFSHMMQKQFEMAWKFKDSWEGVKAGDLSVAKQHAPQLIAGLVSYVIIPAVVEQLVTPYHGSEKDSWGMKAAKVMTLGLAASYIGPKDFVHSAINWSEPSAGLIGTFMKDAMKLTRDIAKKGPAHAFSKYEIGKTINDTWLTSGLLFGIGNAQVGRTSQFLINYEQGIERPRTPWDWMHGLTTGTIKEKRR